MEALGRVAPTSDILGNASLAPVEDQEHLRPVAVIGAGLDLGAGRRGVDMGPSAIRYAGLDARIRSLGRQCVDWGDIRSEVPEAIQVDDERARYLPAILEACKNVAALVDKAAGEGFVPVVLGGDHSVAIGTLGGMARRHGAGGVLWIDAHGDLNDPETSPTGNVHGMPLAAALGLAGPRFDTGAWPVPAVERVALVGIRDLDAPEKERLRTLDAKVFTMSDIDRLGVERAIRESLAFLAGSRFVHVSLDMDALEPEVAPGVGTPVRGGLDYREAHLALELVAEASLLDSLDVVEVNPVLDRAERDRRPGRRARRERARRADPVRDRAGVVLVDGAGVVLVERHREGMHYFTCPGGGVEPGETFEQAAIREAREELEVDVELDGVVLDLDFGGRQVYFRARIVGGELRRGFFDEGKRRGTYEVVRVPLAELEGVDVRPPELLARLR